MNTKLLRQIATDILKRPTRFNMGVYGRVDKCGTTCCIAGETLLRRGATLRPRHYKDEVTDDVFFANARLAKRLSGVTFDVLAIELLTRRIFDEGAAAAHLLGIDAAQADRLFYVANWPDSYRIAYNKAKTSRGCARAGYNRIQHFIKTRGAE